MSCPVVIEIGVLARRLRLKAGRAAAGYLENSAWRAGFQVDRPVQIERLASRLAIEKARWFVTEVLRTTSRQPP